jgi:hypothetical protein
MACPVHPERMDPMAVIALVNSEDMSRRALQGARVDDPVRPHQPGRLTRVRRALARRSGRQRDGVALLRSQRAPGS